MWRVTFLWALTSLLATSASAPPLPPRVDVGVRLPRIVVTHTSNSQRAGIAVRELLAERATGQVADLHDRLAGRIYIHAVTQLEISSTEVRALIAAGRDPRFLMPDGVRDIILDTGCYARKDSKSG